MGRRKENYFIIGLALTLLFVVFGIAAVVLRPPINNQQNPPIEQSPTPQVSPSPVQPQPTLGPHLNVNQDAQSRLLERVTNRKTLSQADIQAKTQILSVLPPDKQSGYVYQTPNINVEFVSSANLFMVEIMTIDVAAAKSEANIWFRTQGLSQDAICNYPVMFYLNSDVLLRYKILKFEFSPVSNGC